MNSTMTTKKISMLFISSDKFPPFRVDVKELFGEEISSKGHKIDWLLQSEKECKSSYKTIWKGNDVWVGKTDLGHSKLNRLKKHLFSLIHDLKMINLVRNNNYQFIQVKDKFLTAMLAIIVARIFSIKFFYWLSFPFPEASLFRAKNNSARYPYLYFIRGKIQKFILYRLIAPYSQHLFVQSEQMKIDMAKEGVDLSKMTVVPMGVPSADILHLKGKLDTSNNEHKTNKIVYLGTLNKSRRIDFLLFVFQRVLSQLPNSQLFLVGDGDDPSDIEILQKLSRDLNIEKHITFTGFLNRDDAIKHVESADVCLSPYYPTPILNSTSPTKLIEYMALGKASVANDHPEQKQILNESKGGICVSYSVDDFSEAVLYILKNPNEAQKMGTRGQHYIAEHRVYSKLASQLEQQYYRLCG